jgi:hypothetical protein
MKINYKIGLADYSVILISVLFVFGCIASSIRSAKTVQPGQASLSGGYMRAIDLEESDADPLDLLDLNGRVGLGRGVDFGIAHTFDLTADNESQFNTIWADVKVQLSNRDNEIGEPTFSLGFMKGIVYDPELHITTLPLMLSIPVSEYITPTLQYRFSLISGDFFPTSFEDPRHVVTLGAEFNLTKPNPENWTPKIGFAVGFFNSLTGGEGDSGLTLNLGFILDSPFSY